MTAHLKPVTAQPGEVDMSIGEQIKNLRKERGWSQADLATKIAGDAGQISRYEHGRITPSVEAIVKFAELFDVSVDSVPDIDGGVAPGVAFSFFAAGANDTALLYGPGGDAILLVGGDIANAIWQIKEDIVPNGSWNFDFML